jgi:hypothetical protein
MIRLPSTSVVYLPELLVLLNKQEDLEIQKQLVTMYCSKDVVHYNALKTFVELMWHPAINWELPAGSPPYTPTSAHVDQAPSSLFKTFKNLHRFLTGGSGFLHDKTRRERFFVVTLESLSMGEAELLIAIKDRDLSKFPNVSINTFIEEFPYLLPADVVEAAQAELKKPQSTETPVVLVEQKLESASTSTESKDSPKKAGRPAKNSTK